MSKRPKISDLIKELEPDAWEKRQLKLMGVMDKQGNILPRKPIVDFELAPPSLWQRFLSCFTRGGTPIPASQSVLRALADTSTVNKWVEYDANETIARLGNRHD